MQRPVSFGEQSMTDPSDIPRNKDSVASSSHNDEAKPPQFEIPFDFDDILAVAISDSVVKPKRRRFRSRGAARRPK
jgi:hypothetical protein